MRHGLNLSGFGRDTTLAIWLSLPPGGVVVISLAWSFWGRRSPGTVVAQPSEGPILMGDQWRRWRGCFPDQEVCGVVVLVMPKQSLDPWRSFTNRARLAGSFWTPGLHNQQQHRPRNGELRIAEVGEVLPGGDP